MTQPFRILDAADTPAAGGRAIVKLSCSRGSSPWKNLQRRFRRELPRQDAVADRTAEQLVDDQERPREPRQDRLTLAAREQAHDAVDALRDGPDAERRRRRLGPGVAVGAEDVGAEWGVHEGRR